MHKCFLLLGSNLGERDKILKRAMDAIIRKIGEVVNKSSFYQTEPWGFDAGNFFLNIVVELNTRKTPGEILMGIHEIETGLGRIRVNKAGYQSRTIDIDILFFDDEIIDSVNLIIPHPRLHLRKFTLMPLAEITPELIHPIFGETIEKLLDSCLDESAVQKIPNC